VSRQEDGHRSTFNFQAHVWLPCLGCETCGPDGRSPFFFFTTEATEGHRGSLSLAAHGSVHFAANCVFEATHVEVDQPPDFAPAQLEVVVIAATGKHGCDGFALRFSARVFRDAAPLCPSVPSVVRRIDGRRPCDVVAQPPGGRPPLNLQLSSRRFGWGSAALGPLW
jgi:hypothetical protein